MAFQKTSSDFCVNLKEHELTQKHLEIHEKFWSPETRPEWFTAFLHKGLVYDRTTIEFDVEDLIKAQSTLTNLQEYRKDGNRQKNNIFNGLKKDGLDLRCKGMHVVVEVDEDGNERIIYVFGGNTVHTGLRKFSNLDNRICYVFKTTKDFNPNNIISVGTYLNSLEKQFGQNDEGDVVNSLNQMLDNGAYPLDANASETEITNWIESVEDEAKWMMSIDVELKKVQSFLHSYIEGVKGKRRVVDITIGSEVETILESKGYKNNNTTKYVSMSCMPKSTLWIIHNKIKSIIEVEPKFFKRGGRLQVINHLGTPDTKDPVGYFFKQYNTYWAEMNPYMDMVNPDWKFYYTEGNEKFEAPVDFLGGFQQIEGLNETWEMETVVSFDEIMEEYLERSA